MGIIDFLFGWRKKEPGQSGQVGQADEGHSRINDLFTDWHKMLYDEYPNIYTRKLCEAYLSGQQVISFEIAVPERSARLGTAILDKFAHRIRDDIANTAKALGLSGCKVASLSYENTCFAVTVDVGNGCI